MFAPLTDRQIDQFIQDGFVKIEGAFPQAVAQRGRDILWRDTGCDPSDSATWTKPVIRLGMYGQPPFAEAANTVILHSAFDQLVGPDRWLPRPNLGTFPVRFPSSVDPGDAGWHIDASFANETSDPNDFSSWRANIHSRGRALLLLFLFSDVGPYDAPTRIRAGSHRRTARLLAPLGEDGLSLRELARNDFAEASGDYEALATGAAGTVYLCHPFLVHAAQPHRGTEPRFLAQPPLLPAQPFELDHRDHAYWPVERAIVKALAEASFVI